MEEDLLAALLAANAELVEALKQYEDLERVALERQAEDRSRKETRMDRRVRKFLSTMRGRFLSPTPNSIYLARIPLLASRVVLTLLREVLRHPFAHIPQHPPWPIRASTFRLISVCSPRVWLLPLLHPTVHAFLLNLLCTRERLLLAHPC